MTKQPVPSDDPRSVDELVNAALCETDESAYMQLLCALHWRGSREVLQWAKRLSSSGCMLERRLAADILGQLGVPDRTFPEECCELLRAMLDENDSDVLRSVLVALSHQGDERSDSLVAGFSGHRDPDIRHAVVLALTACETRLAIDQLILLSRDPDAHVRDWATFGLGSQTELDTVDLRNALAARLDDPDDDARGEALVGLARRKDERVVAALKKELSCGCVGTLAVEAAELIASSELHSELVALREWWDVHPERLKEAIAACQPRTAGTRIRPRRS